MDQESVDYFLTDLTQVLRKKKWIIFAFMAVSFIIATFYIRTQTPVYQVDMIVAPVSDLDDDVSEGNASGRLGSFSLLGSNLKVDPKLAIFLDYLYLESTAERLAARTDLMIRLFPHLWDPQQKSWKEPDSTVYQLRKSVRTLLLGPKTWTPPGKDQLLEILRKNLRTGSAAPNSQSRLQRISFTGQDPQVMVDILNALYVDIEANMRARETERLKQRQQYVLQRLSEVSLADQRRVFITMLNDVELRMMGAASGVPYSCIMVDRPNIPETPLKPNSFLILLGSLVLGILIPCGWFLAQLRRHRRTSPGQAVV